MAALKNNRHRAHLENRLATYLPWLPFLVTVAIRLLILNDFVSSPFFHPMGGDRGLYHDVATAIAQGNPGPAVFTFLPLYPYLIGALYRIMGGPDLAAIAVMQAFLDGFTALMIFGMTRRRYGIGAALLAGFGFALMGTAATYSPVTMPVSLGLFWTMLAVTISDLWKDQWTPFRASVMGFVLGTGGQILGMFWLMIVPFGIWIARSKPRPNLLQQVTRGMLVIACGYACLFPSLAHNVIHGRQWVAVTAHGGLNLFIGNNPASKGYGVAIPGLQTSAEEMVRDSQAMASRLAGTPLTSSQSDRFWRDAALKFWRDEPAQALGLFLRKFHRLVSIRDFDDTGLCRLLPEATPGLHATFLGFGALWILACGGLLWRRPRFSNAAVWIIGVCCALGILMTFVSARYRLPIGILLLPAAAGSLTELPLAFHSARRAWLPQTGPRHFSLSALPKLALGLAGIAVAVIPHPLPNTQMPDDLNRSAHYLQHGDRTNALLFAQRAAAHFPWSPQSWFALGNALMLNCHYSSALDAYNRTLGMAPDRTDAMFNAASALEALERNHEACIIYQRIVDLDPHHAKAWFALAILYRESGDPDRTRHAITRAAQLVGWDHPQIAAFLNRDRINQRDMPRSPKTPSE